MQKLVYSLEQRPPWMIAWTLAAQHVAIVAIAFVLPVMAVREAGGTPEQAVAMVIASMLGGGIGSLAQALRWGPLGSGYLCPQVCGPAYFTASILALRAGGPALLAGMTCLAGLLEGVFSRLVKRMRSFFPAEVTGLIVAMVGISVVSLSVRHLVGLHERDEIISWHELAVGFSTLGIMVGLNVWGKGKWRLFAALIGTVAGCVLAWLVGLPMAEGLEINLKDWAWLESPFSRWPGLQFSFTMLIPFLVAMLCSGVKCIGDLSACQRINDEKWQRPDMANISGGLLADSLGATVAGLAGGMGQSASSSNVGLSVATAATSRILGVLTGVLLVVSACVPKLAALFAAIPSPVMGAMLVFAVSYMIVTGLQIIMTRMMDARRTFVVGISLILGLGVPLLPHHAIQGLPIWLQTVLTSSLAVSSLSALALNAFFRLGAVQHDSIEVALSGPFSEQLFSFLDKCGHAWGARREVIARAQAALEELVEAIREQIPDCRSVRLKAGYDDYQLTIAVEYEGEPLELPAKRPALSVERVGGSIGLLAAFLTRHYADDVTLTPHGPRTEVRLRFEQ